MKREISEVKIFIDSKAVEDGLVRRPEMKKIQKLKSTRVQEYRKEEYGWIYVSGI